MPEPPRHRSIYKELRLHYAAIILIMSLSSLTLFLLSSLVSDRFNDIIDQYALFNNYLITINDVNNELETIIRQEKFERSENFFESRGRLLSDAMSLVEDSKSPELWRRNTDLLNMARTYSNEAKSAVLLMTGGYSAAAIPIYEKSRYLFYLTNQYYYRSYETLLSIINKDRRAVTLYRTRLNAVGIVLIFSLVILSSFLAQKLSKLITFPITDLTRLVSNAAISDHQIEKFVIESQKIDEYKSLTHAYNVFSRRINDQFVKLKQNTELERKLFEEETKNLKIQNLLKESELKALQSRINPHFMFNSINMIKNVAYIEGSEKATRLLESFGGFLRYNYDKFNKVVSMRDECSNVTDYFMIQKIRMGDRLDFELSFDERTLDAMAPCLIVQPLVENSIDHGVGKYLEKAYVSVRTQLVKNRVVLTVYDNGVGIPSDRLSALNSLLLSSDLENNVQSGIGISNVLSRLNIFYKGDIKYEIKSEPNRFTEITIDMPFIQEEVI